jgi:hypothetical protein
MAEYCEPDLYGPFCLLCEQPPGTNRYYEQATKSSPPECRECGQQLGRAIAIYGIAAVGALLLLAALWAVCRRRLPEDALDWFFFAWNVCAVKLKILLGFFMVAPKVPRVYAVVLPAEVKRILEMFEIVIDLNVLKAPLSCLGFGSYISRLTFWMVSPAFTALVMLLVALFTHADLSIRTHGAGECVLRVLERAAPWILRMLFLAYPVVTNIAFSVFACYEFENGDEWLIADVSVQCGQSEHQKAISLATAAVVLYPAGLWFGCLVLLVSASGAIRDGTPNRLSIASVRPNDECEATPDGRSGLPRALLTPRASCLASTQGFLHSEYKPLFYWWELMEMVRRLLLVGVAVFYPPRGSLAQIGMGAMLCAIYLFVQQQSSPFKELSVCLARLTRLTRWSVPLPPDSPACASRSSQDDFTAKCCSFFLLVYFGSCLVFRVLEHLQQPEARGPPAQTDRCVPSHQHSQGVPSHQHSQGVPSHQHSQGVPMRLKATWPRPLTPFRPTHACLVRRSCQPQVQQLLNLRSAEQRAMVELPATTWVCLASVVGTIIFTAFIVSAQLKAERDRQLREQMALRARRLRYKKSGKEVYAPPLTPPLNFHLFLSHVWGTGQDQMRIVKQRLLEMIPNVSVFLGMPATAKSNLAPALL